MTNDNSFLQQHLRGTVVITSLRMMKVRNISVQDYKSFLAQTTATYHHVPDKKSNYHNPAKAYCNTQFLQL